MRKLRRGRRRLDIHGVQSDAASTAESQRWDHRDGIPEIESPRWNPRDGISAASKTSTESRGRLSIITSITLQLYINPRITREGGHGPAGGLPRCDDAHYRPRHAALPGGAVREARPSRGPARR